MTGETATRQHTFLERLLGRHDYHPTRSSHWLPGGGAIIRAECSVCGARQEYWVDEWRHRRLTDEEKAALGRYY